MANQLSTENQELIKEVDKLKLDQEKIINKHIAENKQRDIKNQIKFYFPLMVQDMPSKKLKE